MSTEKFKKQLKHFVKENLKDFYWAMYGNTVKNPSLPDNPKSFLFVCKGNVCRSPFAEKIAIKLAEKKGFGKITFYSVGLEVSTPSSSPEEAILAAESFGVDLKEHISRGITHYMVESFEIIVATDASHWKLLRESFPHFRDRVILLPLFEKDSEKSYGSFLRYNIPDPYGQPVEQFLSCYERIERCLDGLFTEIRWKK